MTEVCVGVVSPLPIKSLLGKACAGFEELASDFADAVDIYRLSVTLTATKNLADYLSL